MEWCWLCPECHWPLFSEGLKGTVTILCSSSSQLAIRFSSDSRCIFWENSLAFPDSGLREGRWTDIIPCIGNNGYSARVSWINQRGCQEVAITWRMTLFQDLLWWTLSWPLMETSRNEKLEWGHFRTVPLLWKFSSKISEDCLFSVYEDCL